MLFSLVLSAQGVIFNIHLRRLVLSQRDFKIPALILCIKYPMATSVWGGKKGVGAQGGEGGGGESDAASCFVLEQLNRFGIR